MKYHLSHYSLIRYCWMEENPAPADRLIGSLSHYLHGVIHPRWCRISSTKQYVWFYHWMITCEWIFCNDGRLANGASSFMIACHVFDLHLCTINMEHNISSGGLVQMILLFQQVFFFWFPWLIFRGLKLVSFAQFCVAFPWRKWKKNPQVSTPAGHQYTCRVKWYSNIWKQAWSP